jgi:hypothetical protein
MKLGECSHTVRGYHSIRVATALAPDGYKAGGVELVLVVTRT